jgi:competence protein ComGC
MFGVLVMLSACSKLNKAQHDTASADVRMVRSAAEMWTFDHPNKCPTFAQLKADRQVSESTKGTDPWGTDFRIRCDTSGVTVTSAGPDKKFDTADDVTSTSTS